jgi:hypothetical protein
MKDLDKVGVTFANLVMGCGLHNGVVNVTLGAFLFEPAIDAKTVDPSPVVVSRLRTDMPCARALHKSLGDLLESIDNPARPDVKSLKHDPSEPVGKAN